MSHANASASDPLTITLCLRVRGEGQHGWRAAGKEGGARTHLFLTVCLLTVFLAVPDLILRRCRGLAILSFGGS